MNLTARSFRILSLDGGGIKGAFTAAFLCELEQITGKRIVDHFDLIVGTSTGGIIAIGMALGIDLQRIESLYRDKGSSIFPSARRFSGWWGTKYRPNALRTELEALLGDRWFGESQNRLVITALNADDGDVKLYKTAHHARLKRDYLCRAVDVALATSAAPSYFPAHTFSGGTLVDGGVWANCPAMVGVIEAISMLGVSRCEIDVLSIGTTKEPFFIPTHRCFGGKLRWCRHTANLFGAASEASTLAQVKMLTQCGSHDHGLVRINPVVSNKRFTLDKAAGVTSLCDLGKKHAEHEASLIDNRFLHAPASEFVPLLKPVVMGCVKEIS